MQQILATDAMTVDWRGRTCPYCCKGRMGPLLECVKGRKDGGLHKCNRGRDCGKYMRPHHCHPLFYDGKGQSYVPLWIQASVLLMLLTGCTTKAVHLCLGVGHKLIESMHGKLLFLRKRYVEEHEKTIHFGGIHRWVDVEADEAVFRSELVFPEDKGPLKEWEQWAGCVQRCDPRTLVLWRTHSSATDPRAPGPGAIKKSDWLPFAKERLANRNVILHSDGARSYRLRVPGMLHDRAVHSSSEPPEPTGSI